MDDPAAIGEIDRSRMLERVAGLGSQCWQGWRLGLKAQGISSLRSVRRLLVVGVGGSAMGADFLNGLLEEKVPRSIQVHRSYTIPAWVDRRTGVLILSYSGNTEETLSAGRQAAQRGAKLAAITSGGKLAAWASRAGFPLVSVPPGFPPRAAIGYMSFAPLGLLVRLGWVKETDLPVEEACGSVERFIHRRLHPSVRVPSNLAKRIAGSLVGRLPILYGSSGGWEGITFRWRTQLEENAKSLAFHHLFPEATHNELSGWVQPQSMIKRMSAVFLTDPALHPRVRRRMAFTAGLIRRQGAKVLEVSVPGPSVLSRMLGLLALGDFVSVYLGLLYRVDPTPVDRVEALKRYMVK